MEMCWILAWRREAHTNDGQHSTRKMTLKFMLRRRFALKSIKWQCVPVLLLSLRVKWLCVGALSVVGDGKIWGRNETATHTSPIRMLTQDFFFALNVDSLATRYIMMFQKDMWKNVCVDPCVFISHWVYFTNLFGFICRTLGKKLNTLLCFSFISLVAWIPFEIVYVEKERKRAMHCTLFFIFIEAIEYENPGEPTNALCKEIRYQHLTLTITNAILLNVAHILSSNILRHKKNLYSLYLIAAKMVTAATSKKKKCIYLILKPPRLQLHALHLLPFALFNVAFGQCKSMQIGWSMQIDFTFIETPFFVCVLILFTLRKCEGWSLIYNPI